MVNFLSKILYYIKVLNVIIRNNFFAQFQYRANIFIRFLGTFAELFLVITFFSLLFKKTSSINGWGYFQILVLTCIFDIIKNILLGCFVRNLPKIEDIIINGKLDLYITKPIDNQFYISFQQISFGHIIQILVPLSILFYVLAFHMNSYITIYSIMFLLINTVFGIILGYSLWIFIMSLSFYVVKIKSLHEIFLNLLQLGKYPSSIYEKNTKFVLRFLFPILMVAGFPVEIFLKFNPTIKGSFILILISITSFFVSRFFWKKAILNYESSGG